MRRCSVLNCLYKQQEDSEKISFFAIPKNSKLAQKWRTFCGDPRKKFQKCIFVCSKHFKPDDIVESKLSERGAWRLRLKREAVPSIMGPNSGTTKRIVKRKGRRSKKQPSETLNEKENVGENSLKNQPIKEETPKSEENTYKEEKKISIYQPAEDMKELTKDKPNSELLDTESSEAVIDELSNQIKDLRLENLRLKMNFQLTLKKYKAEIEDLQKKLHVAESNVFLLEQQLEDADCMLSD